jgi:hypothetical protein
MSPRGQNAARVRPDRHHASSVPEDPTTEVEPRSDEAGEVVDGLPVVASTREITHADPPLPARQAAVVAVSGFAMGAASVALVHRRKAKVVAKRASGGRRKKGIVGEIVGSNSFLVDVHLIRRD